MKYFSFTFFFLAIFFYSCASKKLVPPEIKKIAIETVAINEEGRIELKVGFNVFNPNEEDFELTLASLNIFKETEELVGSLEEEVRFTLVKQQDNLVHCFITLRDKSFVKSIYNFLVSGKVSLVFQGEVIYHHKINDFKFTFNETKVIDLKQILF